MNSAQIKRDHVLTLMFKDGFGPDEALAHVDDYCRELTGTKPSPSARAVVARFIRSTYPKRAVS